ncbi:MAG: 4'-phosphopantetheinyl transferase superfamily protein [Waddliaceae bacterium]
MSKVIELWREIIPKEPGALACNWMCLAEEERSKACQYLFPEDQNRFVHCRAFLRRCIGKYRHIPPNQVSLQYHKNGKPYLERFPLKFNLSHSQNYALFGFCFHCEIGVDIEYVRGIPNCESLCRHYFSDSEMAFLESLPQGNRSRHFLILWTRKEALLKGIGIGIGEGEKYMKLINCLNETTFQTILGSQFVVESIDLNDKNYVGAVAYKSDETIEMKWVQ